MERYDDNDNTRARCEGYGSSIRLNNGRRGYKHFICGLAWDDDESEDGIASSGGHLHVLGKNPFTWVWAD